MSENAPTRSLDDIDLAALRVSIIIITIIIIAGYLCNDLVLQIMADCFKWCHPIFLPTHAIKLRRSTPSLWCRQLCGEITHPQDTSSDLSTKKKSWLWKHQILLSENAFWWQSLLQLWWFCCWQMICYWGYVKKFLFVSEGGLPGLLDPSFLHQAGNLSKNKQACCLLFWYFLLTWFLITRLVVTLG